MIILSQFLKFGFWNEPNLFSGSFSRMLQKQTKVILLILFNLYFFKKVNQKKNFVRNLWRTFLLWNRTLPIKPSESMIPMKD